MEAELSTKFEYYQVIGWWWSCWLFDKCLFSTNNQSASIILIILSSMSPFARGRGSALPAENDRFRKLKSNTGPGNNFSGQRDFIRRIKLLGYEDYHFSKNIIFLCTLDNVPLLLLPTSSMIHLDIIDNTEKWVDTDCTQYNNTSNPPYFSIEKLLIRKCQEVSLPGTHS